MVDPSKNWIKLHRSILSNRFWQEEKFTRGQAWVDLLLLANHEDGFIRVRGKRIEVKRGQIGWSQEKLAERWKWSRKKVSNFLSELEEMEQQIAQHKNNVSSLITIVNYETYQTKAPQKEQQEHSRSTAEEQQKNTNKNDKKEKKVKEGKEEESKPSRFTPPTLEEVQDYCRERNNGVNADKWVNHYTANGWKVGKSAMKDWKAAVRTWEPPKTAQPEPVGSVYIPKNDAERRTLAALKRYEEQAAL